MHGDVGQPVTAIDTPPTPEDHPPLPALFEPASSLLRTPPRPDTARRVRFAPVTEQLALGEEPARVARDRELFDEPTVQARHERRMAMIANAGWGRERDAYAPPPAQAHRRHRRFLLPPAAMDAAAHLHALR